MDAFDIKLEKHNTISKQHQLSKVAYLLRFVEVCILLGLISRFTTHLPMAVKNSGEYFRGLSVVLVSPWFVFVVGNAIIIILLAKAGQFSTSTVDLYDKFVEKSKISHMVHRYETEKKIVSFDVKGLKGMKNIRKTKSENLKPTKNGKQYCNNLRRSGSEKYVKHVDPETESTKSLCPEDGMSNEQFRDTVEAFIAEQKKLLWEEEYLVILKDLEQPFVPFCMICTFIILLSCTWFN